MSPLASTKLKFDGPITIATGRSRKETSWKNQEMQWSQLVFKLSHTTRTPETYAEYVAMAKSEQDQRKDVGGFVGGTLKNGRRKAENVTWRQVVTLDADFAQGDLLASVEILLGCSCVVYSTHKHSPEKPRLRLVLPLQRPVTPDEYQAISRRIAADLGIDFFDDTTYQPHRLMYWPSTSADGEFVFRYLDDPWLSPDEVLARYSDWQDQSLWPESSRAKSARQKLAEKQGDPLEKEGWIGAFCRAYGVEEALEAFLSEVYEPAGDGRYTFINGSTTGGLVVYDDGKFAYSHHGTDPISGQLVNAFDLVRIHKFGIQDDDVKPDTPVTKLPSFKAMIALAEADPQVQDAEHARRMEAMEAEFTGQRVSIKDMFFQDKKFIAAFLGEWFLKQHDAILLNDDLYIYEDGVYVKGERLFQEKCTAILGTEFAINRLRETMAYIKNTVEEVDLEVAVNTGHLLNVKNGLLDLNTMELLPHTPDLKTIVQLPVSYDPGADTTAIDTFINLVAPADAVPVLFEMAGYCLTPEMKYEKALLLYGEGGNGKGTFIEALSQLLGVKNVSQVSFQDLAENKFASADLFGKMANMHADIPDKVLENSSRFKELVSGDLIRAEEKYKGPFSFKNRAKLIFSANEPPISKDNTEGFHRRLLFVPFSIKFNDRKLRQSLFTPEALSGFLLRALEGLQRLRKQEGFTESGTIAETLLEYRKNSDTVARFLDECCELNPESKTGKQVLYDAYRNMCFQWGNHPINQAKFNGRLQAIHPEITEYRKGTPRKWRGIALTIDSDFLD